MLIHEFDRNHIKAKTDEELLKEIEESKSYLYDRGKKIERDLEDLRLDIHLQQESDAYLYWLNKEKSDRENAGTFKG